MVKSHHLPKTMNFHPNVYPFLSDPFELRYFSLNQPGGPTSSLLKKMNITIIMRHISKPNTAVEMDGMEINSAMSCSLVTL